MRGLHLLLACAAALSGAVLTGCAAHARSTGGSQARTLPRQSVAASHPALANAQRYLEERPGWDIDCSGFVRACYRSEAMTRYAQRQPASRNMAQVLFRYCTDHGKRRKRFAEMQPGDIVIFNKTYDANRDGAIDEKDRWTHAGIVESYEDGVLTYLDSSRGRKGDKIRRRAFSIRPGGLNERVAVDPKTGTVIRHRETFDSAFGLE